MYVEYITDFDGVSTYSIPSVQLSYLSEFTFISSYSINSFLSIFDVSAITFEEGIVIVYFSFLNFISNPILHVFIRSPIDICWEPSGYFFEFVSLKHKLFSSKVIQGGGDSSHYLLQVSETLIIYWVPNIEGHTITFPFPFKGISRDTDLTILNRAA